MRTLHNVSDFEAGVPGPEDYWFLGVSGTVVVTGFFVGADGRQVGDSFSTTLNAVAGNPLQLSTAIPLGAYGAIVRFAGDVHFQTWTIPEGSGATYSADFKTNYARYPKYPGSTNVPIGRVSVGA